MSSKFLSIFLRKILIQLWCVLNFDYFWLFISRLQQLAHKKIQPFALCNLFQQFAAVGTQENTTICSLQPFSTVCSQYATIGNNMHTLTTTTCNPFWYNLFKLWIMTGRRSSSSSSSPDSGDQEHRSTFSHSGEQNHRSSASPSSPILRLVPSSATTVPVLHHQSSRRKNIAKNDTKGILAFGPISWKLNMATTSKYE